VSNVDNPLFEFETDFAGSLRCIPMCIRYQLDAIGIKLSLRQWNVLSPEERRELVSLARDEPQAQTTFTERLFELVHIHDGGELERVPAVAAMPWDGAHVPPRIISYASGLHIAPPSPERWASLTPLQRFALYKLTRPNHDNDNFIPALREFGLLD
jgi:hypothetical protein